MRKRSQSGVTLAELMITISILGLLMVISIPSFLKRNEVQKLQVAADMVSNGMRICRQRAVATRMPYRMDFNYSTGMYQILREVGPGNWELDPPNNLFKLPGGIMISPTSTPSDGTIEIELRGTVAQNDLPTLIRMQDRNNSLKSVGISRSGMVTQASGW